MKHLLKNIIGISVAIATTLNGFAQQDPKAKSILDKLSQKTKSYTTIKAEFNYTMINESEGINETQPGSVAIKGDKYYLSMAGQEIYCNGTDIWTHLVDAEEVKISEFDEEDEDAINPKSIFTMYESGFKYKFIKTSSVGGNNLHQIDLFPTNVDDVSYHTAKLFVDEAKTEIVKMTIYSKDGANYTYKIKSFSGNTQIPDSKFTFDPSKHPDVEVIDLR